MRTFMTDGKMVKKYVDKVTEFNPLHHMLYLEHCIIFYK